MPSRCFFAVLRYKLSLSMKKFIPLFFLVVLLMGCNHGGNQPAVDLVVDDSVFQCDSVVPQDTVQVLDTTRSVPASSQSVSSDRYADDDNMRGFDPSSEDDTDDNGMGRYFENNDEEGWD